MIKLSKEQTLQELSLCAAPLWAAEAAVAQLPGRVAMAARILKVDKEKITEAESLIDQAAFALEQLHKLGESAASLGRVDVTALSGGGGNKPPALD